MKILIELPTWLGDAVMTTPAMENIINYYNNPEITLVGSSSSIELLKNHPKVINTEVLNKQYTSLYKFARNLGKFDVFFSFRTTLRSKLFKFFVLSVNKYQHIDNHSQGRHQVEKYNDFVNNSLNTNYSAGRLNIGISSNSQDKLNSNESNYPTLGINTGGSYGDAKRWYAIEFAEVAAKLCNQYNIIIFGGPGEKDIASDIEKSLVKRGITNYQNLAGHTSMSDLIDYISRLSLFITGDSGPMHIASYFQVTTVAIFGPTKAHETSQWMNNKSIVIQKNLSCQPCMKRSCPLKHNNCMKLIKSVDVLDAINNIK